MRKLPAFLTLIGFLIASQIQFIHAMDMGDMYIHHNMAHMTMKNSESVFCNTDPTKQNPSDCAKEIIQDKGFSTQNNSELKKNDKKTTYLNFLENQIPLINKISINVSSHSPPGNGNYVLLKSIYSNLTGIIKNLN